MTSEAIEALGFDSTNPETCLFVEAALDWLLENTTLEFDTSDVESLNALPAGAKLFLRRYASIMGTDNTVTSESIGGMSQSFSTSSKNNLLMDLANDLLSGWLKSSFSFVPAVETWNKQYIIFAKPTAGKFELTKFTVSAPDTARKNRNMGVGISATADEVCHMTVQLKYANNDPMDKEIEVYPRNTNAVASGMTDAYSYSKVYKFSQAGTYKIEVTAYDENGNRCSIEKIVVVK